MKRTGNLIEEIAKKDNLYLAYYKASKGKLFSKQVHDYSKSLHENINNLQNQILSGNVIIGNYTYFTIKDPKVRTICAADFSERVLHHAIMNICHPFFEQKLIFDSYATRIDKGIYVAIEKAQKALKNFQYVAKMDFKKYFDSISHSILKKKLEKIFKDKKLLSIFNQIIDSYNVTENYGIPIGNLTSQYFANYYLSELDHYAKEVLKIPVYIRYMDDILILEQDKDKILFDILKLNEISSDPNSSSLTLKPVVINKSNQGISFLGYKLFPNKILLNQSSKKRFKKKNKIYREYLKNNQWTQEDYKNHIVPLFSFVEKAYSKKLRKTILKK